MNIKKTVSVLLAVILAFSVFSTAFAVEYNNVPITAEDFSEKGLYGYVTNKNIDKNEISNAVVIPGLFQSRTRLYNEDGTVALNSDGEEYSAPFYLDTTGEIVKKALKKILLPLLVTLITRHDFGGRLAKGFGEGLGEILGTKIASDSQGKMIYNVKADKYNDCLANLSQEERDYIYDQIPLIDYADIVGEDHLYFFSYCSFGNINDTVDELYDLIKKAADASPTGKANIVPISQGGSLAVNLFERHPEVGQYLDRVIYIVPALDGTVLMGDIFAKGLIDDNKSLYDEIFPVLLYDDDQPWLGYLVDIVLHIIPNKVLNNMLDLGVDGLVKYLKNSTCIWGLIDSASYPVAADKYLSGEEDSAIRAQTDAHRRAQLKRYTNIEYQMNTYGVKVFDIVDYNYGMYPLVDSWKQVNSDGIIHLDSTSMGATSVAVDKELPSDYVPAKGAAYVDKYNLVDAGTGLLPDTTFYFHNQDHESTARNDIIIKLATCLLSDNEFTSVNSYPDKFPQFNETRDCKGLAGDARRMHNMAAQPDITPEEKADLKELSETTLSFLNNTTNGEKEHQEFNSFYIPERNRVLYHMEPTPEQEKTFKEKANEYINNEATVILKAVSHFLYVLMGD